MYARKKNRLEGHDYSQPGYYYVTICTRNREELFGVIEDGNMILNDCGGIIKDAWLEIPNHSYDVAIDEFTIMPNHVHGIVVIVGGADLRPLHDNRTKMVLSMAIHGFKSSTTRKIHTLYDKINPIWQRNYYDHIIRDEKSLYKIREYIRKNISTWACDRENNHMRYPK
jgi:putative transposase